MLSNITRTIMFIFIILLFLYIIFSSYGQNTNELFTNTPETTNSIGAYSNEAIQSIASVYNKNNLQVNNLSIGSSDSNVTNINSNICIGNTCINGIDLIKMIQKHNKNEYMYSDNTNDYVIYDNIINTLNTNTIISKSGDPSGWDSTQYATKLWSGKSILSIGTKDVYPNGLLVNVPAKYSVIWLRLLNDNSRSPQYFTLYNTNGTTIGSYGCHDYVALDSISPDGSACATSYTSHFIWYPIALPNSSSDRSFILTGNSGQPWMAGIAFSTNPWNHAYHNVYIYYSKLNGDGGLSSYNASWYYSPLGQINGGKIWQFYVPCINSGKDKLLYIINQNDPQYNQLSHTSVSVNNTLVGRFKTTYDNPFSRHYNSRTYQRYLAILVPSDVINKSSSPFINVAIDMTTILGNELSFREMGTHDAY